MRDTIILYDTLLYGIELPASVVTAINRKTEQYYVAEEYKFRVEREKRESERKKIEAEGIRDFQQIVSQGISESYLRWRGIEATLQLSQSTNSKVVIIGNAKDGLPIILGNVDAPAPAQTGGATPGEGDLRTTAAAPARPLEKTPAAALSTPTEKTPTAASPASPTSVEKTPSAAAGTISAQAEPRASWPPTLSDVEAFISRMVRPAGPKTEVFPKPADNPADKAAAEPPR
jgi:hypothetical protein